MRGTVDYSELLEKSTQMIYKSNLMLELLQKLIQKTENAIESTQHYCCSFGCQGAGSPKVNTSELEQYEQELRQSLYNIIRDVEILQRLDFFVRCELSPSDRSAASYWEGESAIKSVAADQEERENQFRKTCRDLEKLIAKSSPFSDGEDFISPIQEFVSEIVEFEKLSSKAIEKFIEDYTETLVRSEAEGTSPGASISNRNATIELTKVQFSVIVPRQAQINDYLMFSIYMYEEAFRSVIEEALNEEANAKEHKSGFFNVEDRTIVKIILNSPDLDDPETETSPWNGKYLRFDFAPAIPDNFSKKQILFIASVYFNDVLTTKLKFVVTVDGVRETKPQISRKNILSAFISYASQDRSRVATIIQGMKKVRPDLDIFFDVENLRSGEKWADVLRKEIDDRDILYLFWSHFARESEWVDMEWRYALERKGIDYIEPVPIEPPDNCPPPKELSAKHFNDRELLYYQNSHKIDS